jgi:2-C-methyl-D-erythritol 4-phosphate cytidylyltransferase
VPKAFVTCAGRELWRWSADVLVRTCNRVVFAVPREWLEDEDPGLERIVGGSSRSESVRNALALAPDADIVVIQDAARPFVSDELVQACIAAVEAGADGAIAAAPVTDTVKEADADGRVTQTLDRSVLWSVQTPQAFRAEILGRALDSERIEDATDDATLVEALGGEVRVVEAPARNFKVTSAEDLARADSLLC